MGFFSFTLAVGVIALLIGGMADSNIEQNRNIAGCGLIISAVSVVAIISIFFS